MSDRTQNYLGMAGSYVDLFENLTPWFWQYVYPISPGDRKLPSLEPLP